ncbi:ras-specific guanine nucleotide-releasing factor 1 isoform X1 [Ammospiza nelsoni]|uniref:ras-specific guanine nucleotide-releasing factor 1 isoform X1 n=1 Tax=Melospiza georgiana TaxID=44398 RepID=UPI0025AD1897|nr:ras-specific guanine nucleotide-releasing factor 1 isoform X1 [Melospiza georgiana]XP_057889180.1 ras-specific guanine nucleotide-releasing factor 1 isoform X2 [Melospiza georgiana]XP_057889181.1 ras-specific guanine nucleotide-releasing factor 1 isoform X3 [Melospiza georgiana]XP_059338142.1 ras-specific guanine nucleotide-releasing factor 1 isoform X1 [Ammospiza nelsoni]
MQKGMRLNDGHVAHLGLLAKKDGARRGYLSKRSADNTKWHTKWFALLQNMLFYFETDSSSRPSGLYLLEGCVCDRAPSPKPPLSAKDSLEKQHYFTVNFNHENQKTLELRTEDAKDCDEWVAAIAHASYRNLATEHEALMQKYLHLLQIVETEKTVAKQLRQQIEDGEIEIERLKAEIASLLKDHERIQASQSSAPSDDDSDIKKIKKVQSFLRGWLCRRKWKTIIQDYIRSPHADSMRKRNQVVFSMLEAEAEYVQQLHILVNNFLRPLRMAASSKKPPITHDDVSSIFLNSETIMFLHQIFYQGLKARISSWPTLVLADLFDILLPMLNIYQEFVRNHQYSLQILAHCKQNRDFDKLLKHYEAKPDCEERTLETFLTYPMFQIPRYILTLHELLAHTPHEHVERNSLDYAKSKLEELSRIMHDEVSETENIRKNLAIERMIIEGCEILLDTSQTFVRQGSLIQVPMSEKGKITRGRLGSLSLRKEGERQCFLFSKHLIICTRGSGGKLHLTKNGVISLIDCTLVEEPESTDEDAKTSGQDIDHLDFKIVVEPKDSSSFTVILVASSRQEKAAWTSDISQCVDNIRCNGLMMNAFEENSKVTVPQMIKSDASLYCDDVDIRFSKTMNSCKVLQIRYASVERLLERLTDLRFLSIDFLNTFLHSYRVFTTALVVLDKLITIYKKPISAIPARSLELLFANSQNNKLLYGEPPKSPRANRKFSSPPPLSLSKSSSPSRRRKLSLNIPIITGGKALDLAALSCSSNGYAGVYSSMAPFSKTTLDINKLYVSSAYPNKIPDEGEAAAEKQEESLPGKQSSEVSVREESDTDPNHSDEAEAEASPTKSPTTPKSVKCKNSSDFSLFSYNNGMVMTSCRDLDSTRSALSATSAFAIATAGANEGTPTKEKYRRMSLASAVSGFPTDQRNGDKEFVIRRAATNRVLNVLRHWVSKHSQDFETNEELKFRVIGFLEEVIHDPELLTQERKAAANIIRTLTQEDPGDNQITLEEVVQMAEGVKAEPFENHSALEIAEQLTLLDHLVFKKIPYEEFFGQGWMKLEKNERTPYIMKNTKHFNDVSNLIASEIIRNEDIAARASAIEKWVAVADICRCLHNYNAVLEITSSLNRSAIFRLKKTWLKVSKQTKALIDKLQKLVSSEGRFKNLREALKNCDPPCVPYLGMYLTDLAFIEEGTPNYTEDGLVNFSKMRMISHIIREIRQFQQTSYKIEHQPKVTQYLLDQSGVMDEESLYEASLRIEPKLPS